MRAVASSNPVDRMPCFPHFINAESHPLCPAPHPFGLVAARALAEQEARAAYEEEVVEITELLDKQSMM